MQNEHSQPYSSCLTAHFELKSQRFSRLKLVFRCELRRKKHVNFPIVVTFRHASLRPLYVSACYKVLHNCAAPPQPPNAIHAIWDRPKKRPDPRMAS